MDGKTLILVLIGGGVAAYLAYSLAKGGPSSGTYGGETGGSSGGQAAPPAVVDYGNEPGGLAGFGLSDLGDNALCRVAPSLCSWYNPALVPRPAPGQLLW